MNAEDIAPSPTISRSMLGIRQATMNASVRALAPNSVATTFSRRYPVMRETRVRGVIAEAERTSLPRESSGGFADMGRGRFYRGPRFRMDINCPRPYGLVFALHERRQNTW